MSRSLSPAPPLSRPNPPTIPISRPQPPRYSPHLQQCFPGPSLVSKNFFALFPLSLLSNGESPQHTGIKPPRKPPPNRPCGHQGIENLLTQPPTCYSPFRRWYVKSTKYLAYLVLTIVPQACSIFRDVVVDNPLLQYSLLLRQTGLTDKSLFPPTSQPQPPFRERVKELSHLSTSLRDQSFSYRRLVLEQEDVPSVDSFQFQSGIIGYRAQSPYPSLVFHSILGSCNSWSFDLRHPDHEFCAYTFDVASNTLAIVYRSGPPESPPRTRPPFYISLHDLQSSQSGGLPGEGENLSLSIELEVQQAWANVPSDQAEHCWVDVRLCGRMVGCVWAFTRAQPESVDVFTVHDWSGSLRYCLTSGEGERFSGFSFLTPTSAIIMVIFPRPILRYVTWSLHDEQHVSSIVDLLLPARDNNIARYILNSVPALGQTADTEGDLLGVLQIKYGFYEVDKPDLAERTGAFTPSIIVMISLPALMEILAGHRKALSPLERIPWDSWNIVTRATNFERTCWVKPCLSGNRGFFTTWGHSAINTRNQWYSCYLVMWQFSNPLDEATSRSSDRELDSVPEFNPRWHGWAPYFEDATSKDEDGRITLPTTKRVKLPHNAPELDSRDLLYMDERHLLIRPWQNTFGVGELCRWLSQDSADNRVRYQDESHLVLFLYSFAD
ncbi:hypothetical protein SISNIDRAFT_548543 [Sistotremastrum niveocremeum HHB9708]|uniref:Uncharacterized protein n=1 Tax=Sistotremastrum niveocremeum HHB9708 TaxID=1314777 RepID=A0A164WLD2_9AGAM|nr:hypothetical protein SISNIDRAFT_548543 [Sistotremastrum niveocremeum HHB9708]